ncbi:MAG: hypothetical protein AAF495_05455 [Pseudomonadota bacterium]
MTVFAPRNLAFLAVPLVALSLAATPARAACNDLTMADLNTQIQMTSTLLLVGDNDTPEERAQVKELRDEYWEAVKVHDQAIKSQDPATMKKACAMYDDIVAKLKQIKAGN